MTAETVRNELENFYVALGVSPAFSSEESAGETPMPLFFPRLNVDPTRIAHGHLKKLAQ